MQTRLALQQDLPKVIDLQFERADEFQAFDLYPRPERHCLEKYVLETWLESPIFLLEKDGEIIGAIGTSIECFFWSPEEYLTDYMVFVQKKHRSLKAIKMLYSAVIEFAKKYDLPLHIQHIGDDREKLMNHLGFNKTGCIYTYTG